MIIRLGFALVAIGVLLLLPLVPRVEPATGWWLAPPLAIAGAGLGLLVSQLNNYTLAPIEEERISEAAGVNSAAGSSASRSAWPWPAVSCSPAWPSTSRTPWTGGAATRRKGAGHRGARGGRRADEQHAAGLQLAEEPQEIQDEIIRINTEVGRGRCRSRWWSLLAALIGLVNAFRMVRLPDVKPKADVEGYARRLNESAAGTSRLLNESPARIGGDEGTRTLTPSLQRRCSPS